MPRRYNGGIALPLPHVYSQIRKIVLERLPSLETQAVEISDSDWPGESGLTYSLIESIVWPDLEAAAKIGDDARIDAHILVIDELLDRGDGDVQGLVVIGVLEMVPRHPSVRTALEARGRDDLTTGGLGSRRRRPPTPVISTTIEISHNTDGLEIICTEKDPDELLHANQIDLSFRPSTQQAKGSF